jgi:hypothetical protein
MLDFRVAVRTCRVSFTDARGIRHSAEVQAETLFEGAVLGFQILRRDGWIQGPIGAATTLEIEVREPTTCHAVTLLQVQRWLAGSTSSPNERVRKQRLAALLNRARSLR